MRFVHERGLERSVPWKQLAQGSLGEKSSTHSLKDDAEPPLEGEREPRQLGGTKRP